MTSYELRTKILKNLTYIVLVGLFLVVGYLAENSGQKLKQPDDLAAAVPKVVATNTKPPAVSADNWYPVARVVDGDTIIVNLEGKETRVRLLGINTPEVVDPRVPVQCFGREASARAKDILTGQSVRLETDPSQDRYDKYGRLLAYVWLSDGTNFDLKMIQDGYAYEYTYDRPYKYQADFKMAERAARAANRGLWASTACNGQK